MPIRSRAFPIRASRFVASAATLALTFPTSAAQPRFPDPPPVPFEQHDLHPIPGDAVPHEVVPVPHGDAPAPAVAPMPHGHEAPHVEPHHGSPPHVDSRHAVPLDSHHPAPHVDPHHAGPPHIDSHHGGPVPHGDFDHGAPVPHFEPSHGGPQRRLPPSFEPSPHVPFGHGAPPVHGGDPFDAPPYAVDPHQGHAGPPVWAPYQGIAAPFGPMRRMAPLAMLPPVEADPTLGPPPGTLGHTYYRPSRYIPFDEHPRVGMLDLTLPPELTIDQGPGVKIRVTVHDVKGQLEPLDGYVGEDKHWHFESDPLIPGLPHVYRVKVERVRYKKEEIRRYGRLVEQESEVGSDILGVRYLRLIPGRIVTLEF